MKNEDINLAVIGLGYVGLPLAVEFSKIIQTVGFDIKESRVQELIDGIDATGEITSQELKSSKKLKYTTDKKNIKNCNIFIVTVPTPIDEHQNPNLTPLIEASKTVGAFLKQDDIVIYESTVYPGATEEICVPILEKYSGLKFNENFFCGYSPERINPGDPTHSIANIKKVTSGSTSIISDEVDKLYKKIIVAGTYKADSIKVAEAAKVIENTQRDINIALINELAVIFSKLNIDTQAVLKAAGTKWNFLPFQPGLVGGHCIGVDPYYLTYKARAMGYDPQVILAGRRMNNSMPSFIADQVTIMMKDKMINISGAKALIMGFSFKENCSDVRNTLVADLVKKLQKYQINVDVYDPVASRIDAYEQYGISLIDELLDDSYEAIILAVNHREFSSFNANKIKKWGRKSHVLYDVKHVLDVTDTDGRL